MEREMICNEMELRGAIERLAQLYSQSERESAESAWNEETRREMSEDTTLLRLKIERETAEYLAQKYGLKAMTHNQDIAV